MGQSRNGLEDVQDMQRNAAWLTQSKEIVPHDATNSRGKSRDRSKPLAKSRSRQVIAEYGQHVQKARFRLYVQSQPDTGNRMQESHGSGGKH